MIATVLVANNDPDLLDLITALLSAEGFQTVACRDGLAALRAIRTQRPALAIIDLALPIMDGHELIQRLHQEPGDPLPVIALSAALSTPLDELPQVNASLTRPIDLEELLEHVKYLASQTHATDLQSAKDAPSCTPARRSMPGPH